MTVKQRGRGTVTPKQRERRRGKENIKQRKRWSDSVTIRVRERERGREHKKLQNLGTAFFTTFFREKFDVS